MDNDLKVNQLLNQDSSNRITTQLGWLELRRICVLRHSITFKESRACET